MVIIVDDVLTPLLARAPMPAVGVSVFDRQDLLFSDVHGVADLTTGRPVARADWWDLASLTKTLVTLPEVLARFELDARLSDVWLRAADAPVGDATVRELLSHTAGLPATVPLYRTSRTRADLVSAALGTSLERRPGGEAVYSDLGFLLLGEAVAEQAGQSLDSLAQRRSGLRFGPLTEPVAATEYCLWRDRLIVGEVHDENAYAMDGIAGHAGAFGTLELVTEAARAWFADRVLPEESHRTARSCQATNAVGERFGLGWWLTPTRGLGGPAAGSNSYGCSGFVGHRIWFEPDRGYGVVILSNRIHPYRDTREPFAAWCSQLLAALAHPALPR